MRGGIQAGEPVAQVADLGGGRVGAQEAVGEGGEAALGAQLFAGRGGGVLFGALLGALGGRGPVQRLRGPGAGRGGLLRGGGGALLGERAGPERVGGVGERVVALCEGYPGGVADLLPYGSHHLEQLLYWTSRSGKPVAELLEHCRGERGVGGLQRLERDERRRMVCTSWSAVRRALREGEVAAGGRRSSAREDRNTGGAGGLRS